MTPICSIDGCGTPIVNGRGWCKKHYMRHMNLESQVQMLVGEVAGLREQVSHLRREIGGLSQAVHQSSMNDEAILDRLVAIDTQLPRGDT